MGDLRTGFARTDDGIQLYWRAMGDSSALPLVCCNGVGVSTFFWKYLAHHFRQKYLVILWDYRGHGLSSVPEEISNADLSIPRSVRDLHTVLRDIGVDQPALLLGHSMGCQVILEYCRTYPEDVRGLIPMFGTFGRPLDTLLDSPRSRPMFDTINRMASKGGRLGMRLVKPLYASPLAFNLGRRTGLFDKFYARRDDIERYLEHLNHMDSRVFFRMVELMADHDTEDYLPNVHVPTLVLAAEADLFTPLHRSERMAELIPGAEITVVPEGSHAAIVEHPEAINRRIERFLAERVLIARSNEPAANAVSVSDADRA